MSMHWRLSFEKRFAEKLLNAVDGQIDDILQESKMVLDPDAMGYYDEAEHTTGLGFVILQSFITAMYSDFEPNKAIALEKGPTHPSGVAIAKIANDAANYWKHSKEWSGDKGQKYSEKIENTFSKIGCSTSDDYPLSNILTEICDSQKTSFMSLLNVILDWQKELQGSNKYYNQL